MNLPHYTTNIFKPEISWDSSRRLVVEKMNDGEQLAIAKQSTGRLRYSSPDIRRSFELIDSIRERYAKLFLTNELILAGLKNEKESNQYKRMFRLLDAQIRNHARIISAYRRDSGYRISALVDLATNQTTLDVETMYADLDALADMQKVLDTASQLENIIRFISKRGTGIDSYDVTTRARELTDSLDLQINRLLLCLQERATVLEGKSMSAYLDEQFAKQSHGLDDIHASRLKFTTVKAGFEALNECISSNLATMVRPLIDSHNELSMVN
ncbi:MAG: hypothetical protein V3U65_13945 [Granulosicoccaceae bacterium]